MLYEDAVTRHAAQINEARPHRILLCGPSSSAAGFADALGDLLVAGDRLPRPNVFHLGEAGDLAAPLKGFLHRLGMEDVVIPVNDLEALSTPGASVSPDLAVFLPGSDPEGKLKRRLESSSTPVMFSPLTVNTLTLQLRNSP